MNKDIPVFSWKCIAVEVGHQEKKCAPANETYFLHIITSIIKAFHFSEVI